MCYSAQIKADYHDFMREWGATISVERFVELFWEKRKHGGWSRIPKAMREAFRRPRDEAGFELARLVAEGDREQAHTWQVELTAQSARRAQAEIVLAGPKPTRKAADTERIATNKIEAARRHLEDLQRHDLLDRDARLFPGGYAPVMIARDGQLLVVPMRYQCRLPGWDATVERKYPGTYNARRDKLGKSWGALFGHCHAVMIASRFYENVPRHKLERRELAPGEQAENIVLEFDPQPAQDMLVACLWNRSPGGDHGTDLYSFAAITDDPPAEIAAAGHDRCIIPIKPGNLQAWLNPDPNDLAASSAILDDRVRPYFQHRLAA
ncbi:MAG: SOS response-associated peptidase family protein [Rhodanobacter sp.]